MYAVVETCGKQYRVEPGAQIRIDRMAADEGATITLDRVLMVGGENVQLGTPVVAGATVTAKVVGHSLGEKVITFKYVHRRRYRRRVGFRASHTTLEILSVNA